MLNSSAGSTVSNSKWKSVGPFGRRKAEDIAPRAAAAADDDDDSTTGSRAASA